jgi:hypothetical protein
MWAEGSTSLKIMPAIVIVSIVDSGVRRYHLHT